MRALRLSLAPWLLALLLPLSACDCGAGMNMIGSDVDGSADGRVLPPGRSELCGNGMDDDRNGRIDDGCPCAPGETQACFGGDYPSRGVGACRDGTQTCVAGGSGREWGDWGDSPCVGDVRPMAETCDGADRDCDGMRDEGCPCSAGATQACGEGFGTTGPCRPGTQRCSAEGTWGTSCEGAVGPMAEVCGNGVDDDCDGTVDPTRLCACVPVPEVCGNGVDDDCDGVVDEPDACSPTCVPLPEVCGDGVDQDCDGRDPPCAPVDAGTPADGGGDAAPPNDAGRDDECVEGRVDVLGAVSAGFGSFASNSTDVFYATSRGAPPCSGALYRLPSGESEFARFGTFSVGPGRDGMAAAADAVWVAGAGPACPPLRIPLPSGTPRATFPGGESGMSSILRMGDHVYFDSASFQSVMRMSIGDFIPERWASDDDGTRMFFVSRLLSAYGSEIFMVGRARTSSGSYASGVLARDPEVSGTSWRPVVTVPVDLSLVNNAAPVISDEAVYFRLGSTAAGSTLHRAPLRGLAVALADAPVVHTVPPRTRLIPVIGASSDIVVFVEGTDLVAARAGASGARVTLAPIPSPNVSPILGAHVRGRCLYYAAVVSGTSASDTEVSLRRTRIPTL